MTNDTDARPNPGRAGRHQRRLMLMLALTASSITVMFVDRVAAVPTTVQSAAERPIG